MAKNSELDLKLIAAVEQNNLEEVKRLIKAGANIKATNEMGRSLIIIAGEYSDPEIITTLLQAETDENAKNPRDSTPSSDNLPLISIAINNLIKQINKPTHVNNEQDYTEITHNSNILPVEEETSNTTPLISPTIINHLIDGISQLSIINSDEETDEQIPLEQGVLEL